MTSLMDDTRWHRLIELFHTAVEIADPGERQAWIHRTCNDDRQLMARLQLMVAAHFNADRSLGIQEEESTITTGPDPLIGRMVGQNRIHRRIAHGGMGVVYEAWQDQPRRRVALKVIRSGLANRKAMCRFELESHALGRLQHPGITQIYEAGTFDLGEGGQPYFAMEYIEGQAITAHAIEHGLSVRQRIELIIKVCDALEHAHQRSVIHRDLKPSNILVTAIGDRAQPKVLDFGVARVTEMDRTILSVTSREQIVGTLPYMSPEQLDESSELDHRSDVYSLGVICYELLTGRLPYQATTGPVFAMIRQIREEPPARLSSIMPSLRGDLETILTKVLEKEPGRRYESAAAFAADLRAYLDNEPIMARPPSRAYRMRKFAARNRALVTGVVASFALLLAGLAGTTWQAVAARQAEARATDRFNDLHEFAQSILYDVHDAMVDVPGAIEARKLLIERAIKYLDLLHDDAQDDPALMLSVARAYERFAEIYGHRISVGDYEQRLHVSIRLIDLRERVAAADPENIPLQLELVRAYRVFGVADDRVVPDHPLLEQIKTVISWPAKGRELLAQLATKTQSLEFRIEQLFFAANDHSSAAFQGNAESLERLRSAHDELRELYEQVPEHENLAQQFMLVGTSLAQAMVVQGYVEDAVPLLREVLKWCDDRLREEPSHPTVTHVQFASTGVLAWALASIDPDEALRLATWLIDQATLRHQREPTVQGWFRHIEIACVRRGVVHSIIAEAQGIDDRERLEHLRSAEYWHQKALEHHEERIRRNWVGWWEHTYHEAHRDRLAACRTKLQEFSER